MEWRLMSDSFKDIESCGVGEKRRLTTLSEKICEEITSTYSLRNFTL